MTAGVLASSCGANVPAAGRRRQWPGPAGAGRTPPPPLAAKPAGKGDCPRRLARGRRPAPRRPAPGHGPPGRAGTTSAASAGTRRLAGLGSSFGLQDVADRPLAGLAHSGATAPACSLGRRPGKALPVPGTARRGACRRRILRAGPGRRRSPSGPARGRERACRGRAAGSSHETRGVASARTECRRLAAADVAWPGSQALPPIPVTDAASGFCAVKRTVRPGLVTAV